MITSHQPRIFPANVGVYLSSIADGSMKDGVDVFMKGAVENRERFLASINIESSSTALFYATFDGDDYCRYEIARPGVAQSADALATDSVAVAMMIPLADCTGAVLYDSEHHALMVSHLGRHSTEQYGGTKSVQYMQRTFRSDPSKLFVWLSPSPNGGAYPLWIFDNKSFQEVIIDQLVSTGVLADNIEVSSVDTITNKSYYSHSEFLKGNRDEDGRYAIVAMLH